jgi:hypothetical protein
VGDFQSKFRLLHVSHARVNLGDSGKAL